MKTRAARSRTQPGRRPPALVGGRRWVLLGAALAVVALGALAGWWWFARPSEPFSLVGPVAVDSCGTTPPFATDLGYTQVSFSSQEREGQGLVMGYVDAAGNEGLFTPASYEAFGDIGPIAPAASGAVYVAPRPVVDVLDNPPDERNLILVVNPQTGELEAAVALPLDHDPNGQPYGIMGLTVDCDTGDLYASTLSGSTPERQNGSVWRVDPESGETTRVLDGIDVVSLAVGTMGQERVLLLGAARAPLVLATPLAEELAPPVRVGSFTGTGTELAVRALEIDPAPGQPGALYLKLANFEYDLRALTDASISWAVLEWTGSSYEQS